MAGASNATALDIKCIQQNYCTITVYENPWWGQACEGTVSSQESISFLTFFPLNTKKQR